MPRLVSIQDRTGWAIPGFKAGSWTLRLDHELKEWSVIVNGAKVFLIKGEQIEELPREGLRLSWALLSGENPAEAVKSTQSWSSLDIRAQVGPEKARPK